MNDQDKPEFPPQGQNAESESTLQQETAELLTSNEALQARIEEYERTVQALRLALEDSEAHALELAQAHESCQVQIGEHQRTVEGLRKALDDFEARAGELAHAYESCQAQIGERERTVEDLRRALADSEAHAAELAQAHESCQAQIDERERIVEDLRRALADSEAHAAELAQAYEDLKALPDSREESEKTLREAREQVNVMREKLDEYGRRLGVLSEMGSMLLACINTNEAVAVIEQLVGQIFPDQTGGLYILRQDRSLVEAVVEWGDPTARVQSFQTEECFALRRNRVHLVENIHSGLICKHVNAAISSGYLCVPMMARGEVLGVFHLRPSEAASLSDTDQRLAVTVSEYLAMSLSYLTRHDARASDGS